MVPKIHKKGTSFLSATRYVMHDKQADTAERVDWSETINMGTDNPQVAARVMAATAMDQARLKQEAGIKNTGRKSKQHVFHATLSWHAEEAETLDRDQMMAAAKWFLHKIGASDRQAIVVAHNDQPQPHVHIIMNRVSVQDGRLLSSSMEKIKASEWAEKYERDRGKIYCDQRVINNKARRRGEYVRGRKDDPRFIADMKQQAGNDNDPVSRKELDAKIAAAKEQAKSIGRRQGLLQRQQRMQQEDLQRLIAKRRQMLRDQIKQSVHKSREQVRKEFRGAWEAEHHEQQAQQAAFIKKENTFLGRVSNALAAVDWRELMQMQKGHPSGRAGKLGEAFKAFGDVGIRAQRLVKEQAIRENEIKRQQNAAEKAAVAKTREDHARRISENHSEIRRLQAELEIRHAIERDRLDKERQQLNRQRRIDWQAALDERGIGQRKTDPQNAARGPQTVGRDSDVTKPEQAATGRSGASQAKASDVLPKRGAENAARLMNQTRARFRQQQLERKKERDQERGDRGR